MSSNTRESSPHDMEDTIANIKNTFADVLGKLLKKEQLPSNMNEKDFTDSGCKENINNLNYALKEVKNGIVNTF